MNKEKMNLLDDSEVIALIVGFIIGVGMLALPYGMVKDAKQDGWISVAIGGIYPLSLALLSVYYCKKHPNEDILLLSKKYFGNVLGSILNFIFMAQFVVYITSVASGYTNVLRIYGTDYLQPLQIIIVVIFLSAYVSYYGIKVIGKINEVVLFITIALTLTLVIALAKGTYLNIFPVFGSGIENIIKGSKESALAYGGMESIFLLYPYMKNKNKIMSVTLKGTFISISIYLFITFVSIYYLGHRVVAKALWPVLLVTESVNLPLINSFRLVFLLLWSMVIIKALVNTYYATYYILGDILNIRDRKKVIYWIFPVIVILCMMIGNEVRRRTFIDYIIPKVTIFNLMYISIIAVFIFLDDMKIKKKKQK